MVIIRLSRGGTNKRPFYHVVAADHRRSRDGRYLERLGFYNPMASGPDAYLRLNQERINYWVSKGAQTTERVTALIKEFSKTGEKTGAEIAAMPPSKRNVRRTKAKERAKAAKSKEATAEAAPAAAIAEPEKKTE